MAIHATRRFIMHFIALTQGQVALVDDADHALLSRFRWCYRAERNGRPGYAVRHKRVDGKDRVCYLHREICPAPEGHETIFLNHDRLDCRRANLKVVTKEEARRHHRVRRDSKSGVKGVRYNAQGDTWSAVVYRHGRCYLVGTYPSQALAAAAYERAVAGEGPELPAGPERVERTNGLVAGPPRQACGSSVSEGP
jgi:hypothetical protein